MTLKRGTLTITGVAADADSIALTQTPGGAGNLTLNGVTVTDGVATIGPVCTVQGPHENSSNTITGGSIVSVTSSTGSEVGITFTVTGTLPNGQTVTDVITGPGVGLTTVGVIHFATVTQIAVSGAAAQAITVGQSTTTVTQAPEVVSPHIEFSTHADPIFGVQVHSPAAAAGTYTLQSTMFDPYGAFERYENHADVAGETTSQQGNIAVYVSGIRLLVAGNTWSAGELSLVFNQGTQDS